MNLYICYYKIPNKILLGTKYIRAYSEGEAKIKILKKIPKGSIVEEAKKVNNNFFK